MFAAAMILAVPGVAGAGATNCYTHPAGSYCQYNGRVSQVYINSGNRILMYFDTPLDLAVPSGVGISGVSSTTAATVVIADNPTFAQYFYSSILAAQARGTSIAIQMRTVNAGYLVADRIWLYEQ